ncbi:SGNH/GDSL hydrolase family protein [Defluviitalea phaphyphila]|uniref:SGNH/GDSL hydrolase family protein n=1 Tax=Defluviitalea phaphyphila TaxID=1473580 RepID=UPI00073130C4|nr:GDSL-type esterase/lipase family protein [Defluviitalea phaphyphila]
MIKTTIVALGDSLTYGHGVPKNVNYVERLEKFMPQYFPNISWHIYNSGVSGDTTREALKRLEKDVLNYHPNIVFILFGSNDSAMNDKQFRSLEEYENNLREIITKIKKHNNRTGLNKCIPIPILITPPPVIEEIRSPIRTNNRLKQYGYIVKTLAKEYHCPLIDFFSHVIENENYKELISEDGLHLSKKGYDLLYDLIFSELTKLINYEGVLKDWD